MKHFLAVLLLLLPVAMNFAPVPPALAENYAQPAPPDSEIDPDGKYSKPTPQYPEPRDMQLRYTDIAVLAGVLLLGAFIILKLRHRVALVFLVVFAILYFGFYRGGCVCPIGGIQNVIHSAVDPAYSVSIVITAIVLLPILAALLFGRIFCGAACPLGAIQDVMLRTPVRVPPRLDKVLRWGRWLYLAAAVYFVVGGLNVVLFGKSMLVTRDYLICKYDPFVNIFRTVNVNAVLASDWANAFRLVGPWWLWLITAAILGGAVFIGRPYCRWLCPYGAILGVCSRVSWQKVTVMPGECIDCTLCDDACPFGAIEKHAANKAHCLACARCYAECPKERQRQWQVAPAGAEPAPVPATVRAVAAERAPLAGRRIHPHEETLDLGWLEQFIAANGRDGDAALPILQAIQARHGYLPYPALVRTTELTEITMARLLGLATFYNQFRLAPIGEHLVKVCCGTACHVAGAQRIRDAVRLYLGISGEADTDAARRFTVQEVACIGCCSLAPVMQIDETTFGHLTPETAAKTIETFSPASHKRHVQPPPSHDPVLDDRQHHAIAADSCLAAGPQARASTAPSPSAMAQGNESVAVDAAPVPAPGKKGGDA